MSLGDRSAQALADDMSHSDLGDSVFTEVHSQLAGTLLAAVGLQEDIEIHLNQHGFPDPLNPGLPSHDFEKGAAGPKMAAALVWMLHHCLRAVPVVQW